MSIKIRAVNSISLDIPDETFLLVSGNADKHKEVLDIICGTKKFKSGTVVISGYDVSDIKRTERAKFYQSTIGVIPEGYILPAKTTVSKIFIGIGKDAKLSKQDLVTRTKYITKKYGLSNILDKKIDEISAEEKRRVCIAKACFLKPKVIVAYEPTLNLSAAEAEFTVRFLVAAAKDNSAILIVSSDNEIIKKYSTAEYET